MHKKSVGALLAALLLILAILFSFVFIAKESGHDCIGDDCPICSIICTINKSISGGTPAHAIPLLFIPIVFFTVIRLKYGNDLFIRNDLIFMSIRLNI